MQMPIVLAAALLLSACAVAPSRQQVDLRQVSRQVLGPAPEGTELVRTDRANVPPMAVEGAHIEKRANARGLRLTFERWALPNVPPVGLFSDD